MPKYDSSVKQFKVQFDISESEEKHWTLGKTYIISYLIMLKLG